MLVGIDYGNKLSGTTVIAVSENHDQIRLLTRNIHKFFARRAD